MRMNANFIFIFFMAISAHSYAQLACNKNIIQDISQQALACYILEPEKMDQSWVLTAKKYDPTRKVSTLTYTLANKRY